MKYIISTLLILATLFSCNNDDFDNVTLSIDTVAKGEYFPYTDTEDEKEYIVIANEIHWNNIKTKIQSTDLIESNIDFNTHTVIAVIDEVQSTGGYGVDIQSIVEHENEVVVGTNFTSPTNGGVTLALTRPFHFVKINKIDKTVEFLE